MRSAMAQTRMTISVPLESVDSPVWQSHEFLTSDSAAAFPFCAVIVNATTLSPAGRLPPSLLDSLVKCQWAYLLDSIVPVLVSSTDNDFQGHLFLVLKYKAAETWTGEVGMIPFKACLRETLRQRVLSVSWLPASIHLYDFIHQPTCFSGNHLLSIRMLTSIQPKQSLVEDFSRISHTAAPFRRGEQWRPTHAPGPRVPPLRKRIPPNSWDSHMHVVEPQRFPVSAMAVYKPSAHTLAEAMAFESSLGLENVVFVQPSMYGFDNSCLLDALKDIGPSRGRGVVVVDPAAIDSDLLDEWHSLGVRGLRVNLQSVGKVLSQTELEETLHQHAEIARPRNWIVELYLPMRMISLLESILPRLGVRICIDHFGSPDLSTVSWEMNSSPFDPYSLPGFRSLISLLCAGSTYIKVSAPYRLSKDEHMRDLLAMAREFLSVAPTRVVYATDWPHTRFSGVDISPFTECCLQLCAHEPGLAENLFRTNTEDMFGVGAD